MTTTAVEAKACKQCRTPLQRNDSEKLYDFNKRTYCNRACFSHGLSIEDLIEELDFLLDPSAPRQPKDDMARRLGYKNPKSLARRLIRADRYDLAQFFDADSHRDR